VRYQVIRMCDGKNRLMARGGHGSFPRRERRAEPGNRANFPRRGKWGGFAITILIIRYCFHHGFRNASSNFCFVMERGSTSNSASNSSRLISNKELKGSFQTKLRPSAFLSLPFPLLVFHCPLIAEISRKQIERSSWRCASLSILYCNRNLFEK